MHKRRGFVFSGAVVLAVLLLTACKSAPLKPAPNAQQMDEINRLFAVAEPDDREADSQFQRLAQAVRKRTVPVGDRPCSVSWALRDINRFSDDFAFWLSRRDPSSGWTALQLSPSALQSGNVSIVESEKELKALGSACRATRRREQSRLLNREAEYAKLDGNELVARARALIEEPLGSELLIDISAFTAPEPRDAKTFTAGMALGHAYLWSNTDRRFVCAGKVVAESSSTVSVWRTRRKLADGESLRNEDKSSLNVNLYMNLIEAAKKSLRAL